MGAVSCPRCRMIGVGAISTSGRFCKPPHGFRNPTPWQNLVRGFIGYDAQSSSNVSQGLCCWLPSFVAMPWHRPGRRCAGYPEERAEDLRVGVCSFPAPSSYFIGGAMTSRASRQQVPSSSGSLPRLRGWVLVVSRASLRAAQRRLLWNRSALRRQMFDSHGL